MAGRKAIGIEGTAHTFGAGVIEHAPDGTVRVRSNVADMVRPETGGIHPREAANHHAEVAGRVIGEALAKAGVPARDLDLVAFSRSPGLGPCLRTAATAARALAIAAGKPIVGVNHSVAHLEIGRALAEGKLAGAQPVQGSVDARGESDPILLYASGGNTQIIGFAQGRYRVFGETLDVGVGNFLDKFARDNGIPFPGGPEIEKLARGGSKLLDLPYTIKGMDVAFSGMLTAANAHLRKGQRLEDVCHSIQETAFAMLVEVTERALAHTEKTEVVLGGGVACNERLFEMTQLMCRDRGARCHRPDKPLLVDNGVMIAHLGLIQSAAQGTHAVEDTRVDQRERTDDVPVAWRREPDAKTRAFQGHADGYHGAEAVLQPAPDVMGIPVLSKQRPHKAYRHAGLDARIRQQRTRQEARLLGEARRAGARTPIVLDIDDAQGRLLLERVDGRQLKEMLAERPDAAYAHAHLARLGRLLATLHAHDVIHGDLTTSNVLVAPDGGMTLLDFGLGQVSHEDEAKGVDLHVIMEALQATHADAPDAFQALMKGYRDAGGTREVQAKLDEIVRRGRYRGT